MPSLLSDELATNPFLRADSDPELAAAAAAAEPGAACTTPAAVFGALRRLKDGRGGRAMRAVYPVWDALPLPLARAIARYL